MFLNFPFISRRRDEHKFIKCCYLQHVWWQSRPFGQLVEIGRFGESKAMGPSSIATNVVGASFLTRKTHVFCQNWSFRVGETRADFKLTHFYTLLCILKCSFDLSWIFCVCTAATRFWEPLLKDLFFHCKNWWKINLCSSRAGETTG